MNFYPCKNNDTMDGSPFRPERICGRVMINPIYNIRSMDSTARILVDSGGFQDITGYRLFPWSALERQLRFIRKLQYCTRKYDRLRAESIFIYDQMAGVDEDIINGKKIKKRGTRETAKASVEETLKVARYYDSKRKDIYELSDNISFVGQGIDPDQYLDCVIEMKRFMKPGDHFAFGGFCIIGRMPKRMMPVFEETYTRVLNELIPFGITRFHLLGVCYAPAVLYASMIGKITSELFNTEIELSNDGSAPEVSARTHGRVYDNNGRQVSGTWTKDQKYKDYHPRDLALRNIEAYNQWTSSLHYLTPELYLQQTGAFNTLETVPELAHAL